jgi:hypothetical protein
VRARPPSIQAPVSDAPLHRGVQKFVNGGASSGRERAMRAGDRFDAKTA